MHEIQSRNIRCLVEIKSRYILHMSEALWFRLKADPLLHMPEALWLRLKADPLLQMSEA